MKISVNSNNYKKKVNTLNFPGCYMIMDRNNKPIYVGMSKNVAQRLKAHPLKKTIIENNENFFITSMLINNYENRLMTESRLIKWFKPVLNKYHHPNRNVATGQLPIIEAI